MNVSSIPFARPMVAQFLAGLPRTDGARDHSKMASACLLLVAKVCDGFCRQPLFCIPPLNQWTAVWGVFLPIPLSSKH